MDLTVRQSLELALAHHGAGRLDQAEQMYRLILSADPNEPNALDMLGAVLSQRGRHAEGLDLIDRALAIRPEAADYHANRGLVLASLGRTDEAVAAYRKSLSLRPDAPVALYNLGNALQKLDQTDEAMDCYTRALAAAPNDPHIHCNLGNVLLKKDRVEEAIAAYHRALELRPDYAEAMSNLGNALIQDKRTDDAIEMYRKAVALRPQASEIINNLAGALKEAGQLDEALFWYRKAASFDSNPSVEHNLLYLLNFHPDYDGRAIAAELARWNEQKAQALAAEIQPYCNARSAGRRLRIGYVSPNFFLQAEAHFLLPLLESHDHQLFEIHCFDSTRKPDEITARHRRCADVWHDVLRDDDRRLAQRVRENRVDILVDLTMHLGESRLLAFARKPAPVQITWLAYPGSTGLQTIDYRLTDSCIDPPGGDDAIYSEKSIRLPGCWCCYDPLSDAPQRPVEQSGPITFGSLNNPCKINPKTLHLWAQIMRQVHDSRLLVLSISENQRRQIRQLFSESGVAPARLEFVASSPRPQYLRHYDRIDIGLDPLPYNGITTTCDALWMGVPVVSLTGSTAAGRAGASVLIAAGLSEWVARTPQQFVELATELAQDIPRLKILRANLRRQITQSPLMDARKFTEQVEKVYREVWIQWCESR
ncbi:MAG: tetratricopeptide repeat protein [Tepidisphaeraceae bacterium]